MHSSTVAEVHWPETAGHQAGKITLEQLAKARTPVVLHFVMESSLLFTFQFISGRQAVRGKSDDLELTTHTDLENCATGGSSIREIGISSAVAQAATGIEITNCPDYIAGATGCKGVYVQTGELADHEWGVPRYTNGPFHLFHDLNMESWVMTSKYTFQIFLQPMVCWIKTHDLVIPTGKHYWSCGGGELASASSEQLAHAEKPPKYLVTTKTSKATSKAENALVLEFSAHRPESITNEYLYKLKHEGTTVLMRSAKEGNETAVVSLLDLARAVQVKVNRQDWRGQTALHYAAEAGNRRIVDILLQAQPMFTVDSNIKDTEGRSAKDVAYAKMPRIIWSFLRTSPAQNNFTEISKRIAIYDEQKERQRRSEMSEQEQAAEVHRIVELETGPVMQLLDYAVDGTFEMCNMTMAELALRRIESDIDQHIDGLKEHEKRAAEKSGSSYFARTPNAEECVVVREKIVQCIERIERIRDRKKLLAEQERDEAKFPQVKNLRMALSEFVGVDSFAFKMKSFIKAQHYVKLLAGDTEKCKHLVWVFTGRPGTGKTSIARLLAPVLNASGIIQARDESELFVEAKKHHLKGTVVGETEKKCEEIFEGKRRVIFVDEAYTYSTDDKCKLLPLCALQILL